MEDFKPNIYPIMYWGLLFGLVAGFVLFILNILANYMQLLWFPVFLAGLVWGGFRSYSKQKKDFAHSQGQPIVAKPPMEEFKDAAADIVTASREMLAEQQELTKDEEVVEDEESNEDDAVAAPPPPQAPTPPTT